MRDLKETNRCLEKDNSDLYAKLDSSQNKVKKKKKRNKTKQANRFFGDNQHDRVHVLLQSAHLEMSKSQLETTLHQVQAQVEEMKVALEQRDQQVTQLTQALEETKDELVRMSELYQEQQGSTRSKKNINDSSMSISELV